MTSKIKILEAKIKSLQHLVVEKDHKIATFNNQRLEALGERDLARKEAKETKENFADLKERLHSAELENSRLNGYLQRVKEE